MANIGKAIYKILNDDGTVEGLVGTKIGPEISAQSNSLPYVTYDILGNEPSDTKISVSKLDEMRVDVSSYSTTYTQVSDIKEAIRNALDRYSGTPSGTGIAVQSVQYENEDSNYDSKNDVYIFSQQYVFRVEF
tara:strand:- start:67 stop:465 length:399 start_codon:yes stop_codon:yes gene_type:complete